MNHYWRSGLLGLLLLIMPSAYAAKPRTVKATRIEFSAIAENKVAIRFKLPEAANVEVFFSQDAGVTFYGPLFYVTGNSGPNGKEGDNTILWDPLAEIGAIDGTSIVFKILATTDKPLKWDVPVMGLVGHDLKFGSGGLSVGVVQKIGVYVSYRGNFSNVGTIDPNFYYMATEGNAYNLDGTLKEAIWHTGKQREFSRMKITGGGLLRASRFFYLYGGVGYGCANVYWGERDKMILVKDGSRSGLSLEGGLVVRFASVGISLGCTYTNRYADGEVGQGYYF